MKKHTKDMVLKRGQIYINGIVLEVKEIEMIGKIIAKDYFLEYHTFFIGENDIDFVLLSKGQIIYKKFALDEILKRTIIDNDKVFVTLEDILNLIPSKKFDEIKITENNLTYFYKKQNIETLSILEIEDIITSEKEKQRFLSKIA